MIRALVAFSRVAFSNASEQPERIEPNNPRSLLTLSRGLLESPEVASLEPIEFREDR